MSIEKVLSVEHFNDKLFKFKTTKPANFKFVPGQFTMLGLPSRSDDVMRAYSFVSDPFEPYLEFYSIKAPGGVFTSDLQRIIPGDEIEVSERPVGSLVMDNLKPGKRLWMLATGTGIAPFISIIRSHSYNTDKFSNPYPFLFHSCRYDDEHVFVEELDHQPVIYLETTTQNGISILNERITTMLYNGRLWDTAKQATHYMQGFDLSLANDLTPEDDRIMLCGNEDFIAEMKDYLTLNGWEFGTRKKPGTFVYEKAFVG